MPDVSAIAVDPHEELVKSVCDYLADEARGYAQRPVALAPEDPEKELHREDDRVRALVVGFEDEEEQIGRGSSSAALVRNTLTVAVIGPVEEKSPRRAFYQRLAYQIRASLRGVEMSRGEGFNPGQWRGAQVVTRFDPERLNAQQVFGGEFNVIYEATEKL